MQELTISQADYDAVVAELCRRDFYEYRKYINKNLKQGWWQQEIAAQLQGFYDDLIAGKRPKLVIQSPPQHGKSTQIIDFVSWLAGKNPDKKVIFTSFSERLGVRANLKLQRIYDGAKFQMIFPDTSINNSSVVTISGQSLRNREILEYVDRDGYFRNTTVRGSITGESLDLGIIDDPIKGREEAESITIRDKTWDWMNDDFFTRFSEDAGLLCILTRWHVDDPIGRLIESDKSVKVLSYPAIAIQDEKHRKAGEALFPEHKSLDFLLDIKKNMHPASWESLYQQSPYIRGGGFIKTDKMAVIDLLPKITKKTRYWDKAGTAGSGAYTAGVLIGKTDRGQFIILDVVRGQWSAMERESRIKQTAQMDGHQVSIWIEQEPGSGGKESAENTVRNLAGFNVTAERVTGDKVSRAEPYAAQIEGGNVMMIRAEWNRDFLAEHETFPAGKYKDQVDAAAGAFNKLTDGSYDIRRLVTL